MWLGGVLGLVLSGHHGGWLGWGMGCGEGGRGKGSSGEDCGAPGWGSRELKKCNARDNSRVPYRSNIFMFLNKGSV